MSYQNLEKFEKQMFWVFLLLLLWPFSNSLGNSNDFDIFMGAAKRINYGFSMYATDITRGLFYYYSPIFALIISCFTYLPDIVFSKSSILPDISLQILCGKIIWNTLQVFLSFKMASYVIDEFGETKNKNVLYIVLIFLLYRWFHLNIKYGQFTTILLWSIWYSLRKIKSNNILKLAPLAFGINVKIIPSFWFLNWILDRDFKSILYTLFWFLIFMFIPILIFPSPYGFEQLVDWIHIINPFKKSHVLTIGEGGFIDIASIITKYGITTKIPTEPTVCIVKLSLAQIFWITQLCRVFILFAVIQLSIRLKKTKINHFEFINMGIYLSAIPLFFPHQRDYSLALFIPAVIYLVYFFINFKNCLPLPLIVCLFFGLLLMGCIVFYEFLPLNFRYWMLGVRLQGIGAIIFFTGNYIFIKRAIKQQSKY